MAKSCCNHNKTAKKCRRKDGKTFKLPRRFSKKRCLGKVSGYSMKSSCAPYNSCKKGGGNKKTKKTKKQFFFNPQDPKNSYDVYIDKNPNDTIPIKFKLVKDVKNTIKKLERLYKSGKYSHKRIWQVGMIMYVRLKVLKDKKKKQFQLSQKYFKFLGKRTKIKSEKDRKNFIFKM